MNACIQGYAFFRTIYEIIDLNMLELDVIDIRKVYPFSREVKPDKMLIRFKRLEI